MEHHNSKCLVLNADFTPLTIISWKRAMIWSAKYSDGAKFSIEIIDFYKNDYVCGVNHKKYPIPAVVRTYHYFKIHNHTINFSRKNIFLRDNYTCQYCGTLKEMSQLTYDHVVPKSKWKDYHRSPTNWTNIVTACHDCNRKKGNRTPSEARMELLSWPTIPQKSAKYLPVHEYLLNIRRSIPDEWITYLPASYK